MKTIYSFIGMLMVALFIFVSTAQAWNGEPPFGPESREEMLRRARQMVEFSWSPKASFTNLTLVSPASYSFKKDKIYTGETYTQDNPPQNWAEFYDAVSNNISGGNYYLGNDCSRFVSISWELPTPYFTTSNFESDATSDGGYVTSLGSKGDGVNPIPGLLPGDALVTSGHIILFESYDGNSGIKALEQTPGWARRSPWTWAKLSGYRPIRRNSIEEDYKPIAQWGSYGDGDYEFRSPSGITLDSSGNVYVADEGNVRIQKFSGDGIYQQSISGTGSNMLLDPTGVAVDPSGYIYVADYSSVYKFNGDGNYVSKWGSPSDGGWFTPYDIALDPSGNVYVTDVLSFLSHVDKFTNTGAPITKWGSPGAANGQFDAPYGISVDKWGDVYVADCGNNRIQKFDSNGGFKWAKTGEGDHQMSCPYDVTTDALGYVYVADNYNDRILKFDNAGTYLMQWGSSGTSAGEFYWPNSIAVDSNWNVYVLEEGLDNPRIQKFKPVSPQPAAPTGLSVYAFSANQINLAWNDNSDNETGFEIFRKIGIRGNYEYLDTVPANSRSYADTDITGTNTYYYYVYAYNYYGNSAYSNEDSAIATTVVAAAPSNLQAEVISEDQIDIEWTDNSNNERGFIIERKTGQAGQFAEIARVIENTTTYSDYDSIPSAPVSHLIAIADQLTEYYYRVSAFNDVGNSNYSNVFFIIVDGINPTSVITYPSGSFIMANAITIQGTASDIGSNVSKVEVSINGGAWIQVTGTTSWTYNWTIPTDGISYTIKSRATDAVGNVETPTAGVTLTAYKRTPLSVTINTGKQLLINNNQFTVKGVNYSPVPIGDNPETPPHGDYFTTTYSGIYNRDLPLLSDMGANTIRLWTWDNGADHHDFLDKAYSRTNPIYVIAGFQINPGLDISLPTVRDQIKADFRKMVAINKNHPAILMWAIGNELNSDTMYGNNKTNLFSLINEMAAEAHAEDANHPVTTPLADENLINTISTYNSAVPDLNIWGANIYRGNSFGTLFSSYSTASGKPLLITEYGIDAYNKTSMAEDQTTQSNYAGALWQEISANSASCVGGVYKEYSDQWWAGSQSIDIGCPEANNPNVHGTCGAVNSGFPDSYDNFEWWGLMSIADNGTNPDIVSARVAYNTLQSIWREDFILTVNKTGSGIGTVGGGGTYDYRTTHDITAVAATGSTFTGWSGDCTGTTSPLPVFLDRDKTCTATFNCNVSFTDVPTGYWAENYIKEMYCRNITTGCSQNPLMYCPENNVTRSQMAIFIIRAMGQTTSGAAYNAYFNDIANDSAAPYINRMKELGITTGCGTRLYCPNTYITRSQMAIFIIRAMGQTTSGAAYNAYFNDIANDSAAPYINRMYELGITTGCGTRLYCPGSYVIRSAMAVFIIRAF